MKKVLHIAIAMALTVPVMAQVSVAPKFGLNFSTINYGENLDERFDNLDKPLNSGFNGGLGFDLNINSDFSLYLEVLYSQKGSTYEGSGIVVDPIVGTINVREESDVTLEYVEMPILVRYKFGKLAKFYLNIGPTAGFWIGGSVENHYTQNGQLESVEGKITFKNKDEISGTEGGYVMPNEDVNRLELGAAIGAGVLIGKSGKFNLDFRYTIGLTSIYEDHSTPDSSWKNNVIGISLGYFFKNINYRQEKNTNNGAG